MLPFAFTYLLYGFFEARRIVTREYSVYFDDLPDDFDGYSLLHLSDFHFRKNGWFAGEVRDLVRCMLSDIALLTGDYRYKSYTPWEEPLKALKETIGTLKVRDGVLGCLGNKESRGDIPRLEKTGLTVLRNRSICVRHGKSEAYILGVDERNPIMHEDDAHEASLDGVPEGAFKILLAHTPDYVAWARSRGIQLMLCGDTHGGQVRFPLIGPPKVKSKLGRKYCRGWHFEGKTKLFINSGLGSPNFPIRTLCPPEVVRIVLRKGSL